MGILISLQNINLHFGSKIIFENGGLTLSDRERVGLIGLNGHGKSTLLKIIFGTQIPDQSSPAFIYDKAQNIEIIYIPQELDFGLYPELSIETFYLAFYPELYELHKRLWVIEEKLGTGDGDLDKLLHQQDEIMEKITHMSGWQLEQSYLSYIKSYGLDRPEFSLQKLSGGEAKKISLSVGLSTKADLVLWDEPTNHLDIESIENFEDELSASNKAFIMISHDRYLLGNICNKIFHIQRGDIIPFKGNYLEYMEFLIEKEKERVKELDRLKNRHRRELAWMRQGIKARGTRSKKRVEGFNNIGSDIEVLRAQTKRSAVMDIAHSGRKTKSLVQIESGSFSYGEVPLLDNLNLSIAKGMKIALIGKNGQGKTTLINIIKQQLKLTTGTIKVADGLDIKIFTQNREALDLTKSAFEIVGDGQDFVHLPDGSTKHVNSYLENFLFQSNEIRRPISTLSGGEKNRLQLAMFMKQTADLWIFDEPTNDLDIETIEILEDQLRGYKNSVLIISHDRSFLDNIVDTSWLIHDRKVEVFGGGYTDVAPYLQALEMQKQMREKQGISAETESTVSPQAVVEEAKPDVPKVKMNNKEKIRWKAIEKEIATAESALDDINEKLGAFDFNDMSQEKTKEYEILDVKQKDWEGKLEGYYEEWENLSGKSV